MKIQRTTKGDALPSNWGFRLMAWEFKLRDLLRPRRNILKEIGIKSGDRVLDYGSGPGSYVPPLAEMVGESGKVYALDAHPLAIKMVQNMIAKRRLANVETIHSECETGLPDNCLDVVLLYDTLHDLADPDPVLAEIWRTLKPGGVLSLSDHHLEQADIVSSVTKRGKFRLLLRDKKTSSFGKQ
jgi:ubiquinone/menaquinone biosynthesis C-methylase UbiE